MNRADANDLASGAGHSRNDAPSQEFLYGFSCAQELPCEVDLDDVIPAADRGDPRLLRYGYGRYRELFNARQLLHLSDLAQAIENADHAYRDALAIAFSDHLTTNCMLTSYAFGWRRLVQEAAQVNEMLLSGGTLLEVSRSPFPDEVVYSHGGVVTRSSACA